MERAQWANLVKMCKKHSIIFTRLVQLQTKSYLYCYTTIQCKIELYVFNLCKYTSIYVREVAHIQVVVCLDCLRHIQ